MTVVVFDFDFTLTRWDTADRFFRWLLVRQVWKLTIVALVLPMLGILLIAKWTRIWPIRFAVWVATLGLTNRNLKALARYHAQRVFANGEPVFHPDALTVLRQHVEMRDSVIIATGCLEILARELLVRADCGEFVIVGSTLRPFLGGMCRYQHCVGLNKVKMLRARGFAPPWEVGYTDSKSDLPVLKLCRVRNLVNAKPGSVRTVERLLQGKVRLLSWR